MEKPQLIEVFIKTLSPESQGAIMAGIIAVIRLLYDGKEKPLRIFLEALLCGALSLCASSLLSIFDWHPSVSVAVGGSIGFLGVTHLRFLLLKLLKGKIS